MSPALFEEVIDPVQSKKADEDQIDSHREAHQPRRDQQEYPRDHGGDRQKVLDAAGVHRELIADSGHSGRRWRALRWRRSAGVGSRQIPDSPFGWTASISLRMCELQHIALPRIDLS